MRILARLNRLLRARERGQTMAEYAVVLGVITIALVAVFSCETMREYVSRSASSRSRSRPGVAAS